MAHFRHMIVIVLQAALLAGSAALALELAPGVADAQTRAPASGHVERLDAPVEMGAITDAARRHPLFDKQRCTAMPLRLKASWVPGAGAAVPVGLRRRDLSVSAVNACPHFLSTMSLVKPHHIWRG